MVCNLRVPIGLEVVTCSSSRSTRPTITMLMLPPIVPSLKRLETWRRHKHNLLYSSDLDSIALQWTWGHPAALGKELSLQKITTLCENSKANCKADVCCVGTFLQFKVASRSLQKLKDQCFFHSFQKYSYTHRVKGPSYRPCYR